MALPMKLIIKLTNGKRIQRQRDDRIIVRNHRKPNGKVVSQFFDQQDFINQANPIPFAECPVDVIKSLTGAVPVISTFAQRQPWN